MRFLALLLFLPSLAFGQWTTADTAWEAVYVGAMVLDCAQARDTRPQYIERNPILGPYPSKGRIDNLCALSALGHFGLSYVLPPDWRRIWQISTIAAEIIVIEHQYRIGLKFTF